MNKIKYIEEFEGLATRLYDEGPGDYCEKNKHKGDLQLFLGCDPLVEYSRDRIQFIVDNYENKKEKQLEIEDIKKYKSVNKTESTIHDIIEIDDVVIIKFNFESSGEEGGGSCSTLTIKKIKNINKGDKIIHYTGDLIGLFINGKKVYLYNIEQYNKINEKAQFITNKKDYYKERKKIEKEDIGFEEKKKITKKSVELNKLEIELFKLFDGKEIEEIDEKKYGKIIDLIMVKKEELSEIWNLSYL